MDEPSAGKVAPMPIFFSAYAVLLQKESELVFIAVEHIDVYLASDAIDAAVGTQLPVGQAHIGLVSVSYTHLTLPTKA